MRDHAESDPIPAPEAGPVPEQPQAPPTNPVAADPTAALRAALTNLLNPAPISKSYADTLAAAAMDNFKKAMCGGTRHTCEACNAKRARRVIKALKVKAGPLTKADIAATKDMTFGQVLAFLRERRTLSLKELAFLSGLCKGCLSMLENGKRRPRLNTMRNLEKGLRIRKDERKLLYQKAAAAHYLCDVFRKPEVSPEELQKAEKRAERAAMDLLAMSYLGFPLHVSSQSRQRYSRAFKAPPLDLSTLGLPKRPDMLEMPAIVAEPFSIPIPKLPPPPEPTMLIVDGTDVGAKVDAMRARLRQQMEERHVDPNTLVAGQEADPPGNEGTV